MGRRPEAADSGDHAIDLRLRRGVIAAALLPFIVLLVLFFADVPLGQPHFLVYRYSPVAILRAERCAVALVIGICGVIALHRGLRGGGGPGVITAVIASAAYAALVIWVFVAPPKYVEQHSFNMLSPSHDGAFVLEGRQVASVREYVSTTFFQRLGLEPEDMRGRRVLSNPPGVTVLSVVARRIVRSSRAMQSWLGRAFVLTDVDDEAQRSEFAAALLLAAGFTIAWGAGLFVAYRLCRVWMPLPAAAAVAFACVFNPAAVEFTPGKDPAQLLTVLLIAYCWLLGYVSARPLAAGAAGGVLAAASMIGLIHIWVFAIVAGATFWHSITHGRGWRPWLVGCLLPAIGGAGAVAVLALSALDWNIALTVLRVGVRYREIQLPVIADPFYWTFVGCPVFVLFMGPLFWVEATAVRGDMHDAASALGARLLALTVAVMVYTYFFVNNSEAARLWMPFVPLLLIGMALRRSAFRGDTPATRRLAVLLMALQLTVTLAHWSLMDVRESEHRLTTGRMWD